MTSTFAEVLQRLHRIKHEETIYREMINYLSGFISEDGTMANRSMSTGSIGVVPQELLERVRQQLEARTVDLEDKATQIEHSEVPSEQEGKQEQEEQPKAEAEKPKAGGIKLGRSAPKALRRPEGKAGGKGGGPTQLVRRRKASSPRPTHDDDVAEPGESVQEH